MPIPKIAYLRLPVVLSSVLCALCDSRADLLENFNNGSTNTPFSFEFFKSHPGPDAFGILPAGGNPGGFFQVTPAEGDQRNYVYFDRTIGSAKNVVQIGPAQIDFSFDFIIDPGPDGTTGDGMSFALISTDLFGTQGPPTIPLFPIPEEPSQIGVLGFGFDTWSNAGSGDPAGGPSGFSDYNDVTLYSHGELVDQYVNSDPQARGVLPNGVQIDDGTWHTVLGTVDFADNTVSLEIDDLPVWENFDVPNLSPFFGRVMLGARTGGQNQQVGFDNLAVKFNGTLMDFPPPRPLLGDYNLNGGVEQADLDLVLLNWGDTLLDPVSTGWINDIPTGAVDREELDGVLLNWGNRTMLPNAVAVPEPSMAVLTLLLLFALAWRFDFRV